MINHRADRIVAAAAAAWDVVIMECHAREALFLGPLPALYIRNCVYLQSKLTGGGE